MRQATVDALLVEEISKIMRRHVVMPKSELGAGRTEREFPPPGKKVVVKLQAAERADEVFSAALSQLVSCVKEGIVSVSRCAEDSDCVVKRGNARESKGRGGCIHPSKLVGQPGNRLAFAVRMTRRTGSHQGRATQGKAHIERRRITGN